MNSIEYSAVGIQTSAHSIPSTPCWFGEVKLTELHRRYEESPDTETRTRYQTLLLSLQGQKSGRIAHMVLRSQDTVERVLKRFLVG